MSLFSKTCLLLFFHVPGGVQPGRWELEIALEESAVEIPFVLD